MSTVYVKSSTAINYPPVGHEVLWLNQNGEVFKGKLEEFEDNHSWVNCAGGESISVFDFEYWLREVELPIMKIKSTLLCLQAHPDNEPDSEFADRISDLEEILNLLNPTHNEQ